MLKRRARPAPTPKGNSSETTPAPHEESCLSFVDELVLAARNGSLTDEQIAWVQGFPDAHLLLYGESGSGKSTLAASAWIRGPQLVLSFDPYDKTTPYKRGLTWQPVDDPFYTQLEIEAIDGFSLDGGHRRRIEYYADPNPDVPRAYPKFLQRVAYLAEEAVNWGSVVLDSLTLCQYAYLRYDEKVLCIGRIGRTADDPRIYYGFLKKEMVAQLLARFAWLQTTVIIVAHAGDKKDEFSDGLLRGAQAVGTLMAELPAGYGEVYRMYVNRNRTTTEVERVLQTRSNPIWYAASQVDAPDPCSPHWAKIWEGYRP